MSISIKRSAPRVAGFALAISLLAVGCQSDDLTAPDQVAVEQPGTVNVSVTPVELNAPWFLLEPNEELFEGAGSTALEEKPSGDYELTWAPVPGWKSPTPNPVEGNLAAGSEIDFVGNYTPIEGGTGNIAVDVEPNEIDAEWTLTGPSDFSFGGRGDMVLNDREPGTYTLTFRDVVNYETAGSVQGTLVAGARLDLGGRYIYQAPPAGSPVLQTVEGSLAPRGTVTIVGDDFGSHTLDVEWTGDWIEEQAVGTNPDTKPGWNHVYSSHGIRDHISSERAWSGSKSMDLSVDQTLNPWSSASTLGYLREPFETIYVSWWSYIQPLAHSPNNASITQLKHAFVTTESSGSGAVLQGVTNSLQNTFQISKTTSQPSAFYWQMNAWTYCPGVETPFLDVWNDAYGISYPMQSQAYWRPTITGGAQNYNNLTTFAPTFGGWSRQELYLYRGSGPDVPDGEVQWVVTKPDQGRFVGTDAGGVVLQTDRTACRSEPDPWQRFVLELFYDDSSQGSDTEQCDIFVDDIYLQFGTRARVELGDRAAYDDCTRLEVQPVNGWSPESIDVSVNYGGFSSGDDVYLFVVRQDGVVSSGYPVRLP